ncbi:indole-3-glycerol phosphate synthase TrpC [Paludifilum halophilum]|uniref:Indole-3-glycerol phosphate synthase n=1 Tax=Paludifilum halophilum TaxID=1642702 RepID=A0A235BBQ5_9BACL|nr:indole-3-glycerol phosphate synthase TrpC [Paludifilum halophilum]OYD09713.1 indole-3-glycerol phosphate synthase [Paludifilum halophilum]
MFLNRITEEKRKEVEGLSRELTADDRRAADRMSSCRSLAKAMVKRESPALIAEVKPASPSRGTIQEQVNPVSTARAYEAGGASAVSVLTDQTFFHGHPDYLRRVKEQVSLPVLRKDFILHPVQLVESRLLGADAVLLIAAMVEKEALKELAWEARRLGLETLIEVHRAEEIDAALQAKPDVIGINNRNLTTFDTDLAVTEELSPLIPEGIPVIGESGIHSRADLERLSRAGVEGVLVGEYLMRQESPERAIRRLLAGGTGCAEPS